jgi:predicted transglutaminase-like cysteine proteinase
VAHRFANRLLGTVIAIAIQAVIVDSVKWSASARPGPGSHNEVLAHNLVQSEKPLIQPTPTVSLSLFSEPFGSTTVPLTGGELLIKWRQVESKIRSEMETLDRCRITVNFCPPSAQNFLAIIAEGRERSGLARIGVINRAVNLAIRPMSDLKQWGSLDRWSTPLETLSTGYGDCEDYAIAKFVALKQAGLADEDVRLILVRDLVVNEDHAVVAARLGSKWVILDNRWLALVEDSTMHRLRPLFVLARDSVNQYVTAITQQASVEDPNAVD